MKNSVNKLKLTDIGSLSRGKSKHRPRNDKSLYGGKYPFVQTSDVKNANHILKTYSQTYNDKGLSQSKLWEKGTICITIAANIADSAILGFDACFPDSVLGLVVDKNKANIDFIEYLLQYYKMNIQNQSNGTSQENINLDTFQHVYFNIPDLIEQNKIAKVLSVIDNKIDINNKINKELEQTAKDLYDYWFVQFNFPDENKRPYKTNNGRMIYSPILKKEIPIDWKVDKLKNICDIKSGYPFSSDNYIAKGIYGIITIKNVQNGYIDIYTDNYINSIPNDLPQYCILKKGDILLSLTGNVGRTGLIYSDNLLLNQRVAKIILKQECFYSYIYFLISNNYFRNILEQKSTGTSQKNLSPIETENINIIIPDKNTINIFNNIAKSIIEKMVKNWTENKSLIELRDFLLPMLMNGQISIKD